MFPLMAHQAVYGVVQRAVLPEIDEDIIMTVPDSTQTPPPPLAVFPLMVHDEKVTVPPRTTTPPPLLVVAVFPLMVHDDKTTVPPETATPAPNGEAPPEAVLPEIEEDVIVTAPDWTKTPPPQKSLMNPPVMLSPITCTTPDEPGLMFSTRRGLEELACASSTTEPATAASRTTLLVMLSSALR